MTTDEFVKAVNAIDNWDEIKAYGSARGDVFLRTHYGDKDVDMEIAILGKHDTSWGIRAISQVTFPTKILKLMAELADTPSAKRKGTPKYVILNGEPMKHSKYFNWCFFTIGNRGQYLVSHNTTDPEILTQCSYTREEVEETTEWLPEEWRNVINNLLTPLDVALEGRVKHDNMQESTSKGERIWKQ